MLQNLELLGLWHLHATVFFDFGESPSLTRRSRSWGVRSLSIPKVVPENGIKAVIDGLNADVYERYLSYIGEVAPGNNVVRAPNEGCPCRTVAESRKQLVNRRLGARDGPDEPKVFVL